MQFWEFIMHKLRQEIQVELLFVLESEGSSPGRRGFKMAVAADGDMIGTIGGGIMEHKLVEKAKELLGHQEKQVILQRQYHDKEHNHDRSGMICSGSQLNVFIPIRTDDKSTIEKIISETDQCIQLSPAGLEFVSSATTSYHFINETEWLYTEAIGQQPVIHIIGAGHVGLALSELMHFLGYYVKLYDDRAGLNTMEANSFANEKRHIEYEKAGEQVAISPNDLVVIMTMGYRSDKVVLKQVIEKPCAYLGLLGSDHKIKILLGELQVEGISPEKLSRVYTPIGINIFSKTTKEIAVSIAAEIIREKNKDLPTGRSADL